MKGVVIVSQSRCGLLQCFNTLINKTFRCILDLLEWVAMYKSPRIQTPPAWTCRVCVIGAEFPSRIPDSANPLFLWRHRLVDNSTLTAKVQCKEVRTE